ncbi:MAG TPA: reverse transcriptase family protein, partial [Pirellulales bacterium]|nr:reverse transcriptase family protein [Pirellulales bacterium]
MQLEAERLATAFLAGPWEATALYERAALVVGKRSRWLERLSHRIHAKGAAKGALQQRTVVEWIVGDRGFVQRCEYPDLAVNTAVWNERPTVRPVPGAPSTWRIPSIATAGELAAWLGITADELEWFAGRRDWRRRSPNERSRHYLYRAIKKRHGEIRLLEVPKHRLRKLQRQVLHRLLDEIPPPEAAHGFRSGRSIRSFAAPHADRRIVIRLDLRDFFPMIGAGRLLHIFLTAGYPETVSRLLTGLCTHTANADAIASLDLPLAQRRRLEAFYGRPHLPQGAPTSPALANLAAYRLDCRLTALAASMEANYTRY